MSIFFFAILVNGESLFGFKLTKPSAG